MGEPLPPELVSFIVQHIDSVEMLEILSLLQADPSRNWHAKTLNTEIRSNIFYLENRLRRLEKLGFIASSGEGERSYRYKPVDEAAGRVGGMLVEAYQSRRAKVVELIYSKPMQELTSFSDAFLIRKGEKKDG